MELGGQSRTFCPKDGHELSPVGDHEMWGLHLSNFPSVCNTVRSAILIVFK